MAQPLAERLRPQSLEDYIAVATDNGITSAFLILKFKEIKDKYEPRNFLVPAKQAAQELVEYKLKNVFNSANKIK